MDQGTPSHSHSHSHSHTHSNSHSHSKKTSHSRFKVVGGNISNITSRQRMSGSSINKLNQLNQLQNETEPFIVTSSMGAVDTNNNQNHDLTMRSANVSSTNDRDRLLLDKSKSKSIDIELNSIDNKKNNINNININDNNNDINKNNGNNVNINNNNNTNKYETNASLYIRYFFLFSILLQNSSFTLLRRYNKGVLHDESSNASILIGGEFMKIIVSLTMGIRSYINNNTTNNSNILNIIISYFRMLTNTSPKLIFPAFIYLCMNWLSLLSLERIDASTFTVIAQCKTLSTALAGYFFLNKRFSQARIRALIHLVCSVIVITYVANNSINNNDTTNNSENNDKENIAANNSARFMIGVLFVLIEVSLSGCVSVYYEKVLKDDKKRLTVWDRNIQLASFSIIMYFYSFANDGYFENWSRITFFVSFLGALGGVLVAFSIKYTDSVLKAMSTSCAIVLTSVLSALWLDGPYNIPIAVSSISVVVAIFTYVTDGKMCNAK